jgi:glycogen debranching enzyme
MSAPRVATVRQEIIRVGDLFYVLAASSRADDRIRVLKQGETFGVFDRYGDIQPIGIGEQGLYHAGTRHLSRFELLLGTARPLLLGSGVDEDNLVLTADLSNPDLSDAQRVVVPRGTLHNMRSRLIWGDVCYESIHLHNFGLHAATVSVSIELEADFADMFEVRGVQRTQRGRLRPPLVTESGLTLCYDGLDGIRRMTCIECHPGPHAVSPEGVEFLFHLDASAHAEVELKIACVSESEAPPAMERFDRGLARAGERMRSLRARGCEVTTDNHEFNDWLRRSRSDIHLMVTHTPHGDYPYAGIPWFSTVFGRDGIITALQTLWLDPDIARGVLLYLAATQADTVDRKSDAEPGKIVHEVRRGEMANTGEVPFARYYGSADATPLFVLLAGEYLRRSDDRELCAALWPHVQRALRWIDEFGDVDGDGFVEYRPSPTGGLTNQGWKDSGDAISCADGALAGGAVALCEVQGYVYGAKRSAAEIADALGLAQAAQELRAQAESLRERFWQAFWDEALGIYVLALDGQKRPCRVLSSNAGQSLFTGIARPDHARRMADVLLGEKLFSGWGIRTLAANERRYNPMSYHNGSIWPHDNSLIALGLARYGMRGAAARLLAAMLDVASFVESHRLPELFCGFPRRAGEGPILYPLACAPQAWAAGAVFLLLQACLGLNVHAARGEVVFDQSLLPDFLPSVHIRNLRVGERTLDAVLERKADDVTVHVLQRTPGLRVVSFK